MRGPKGRARRQGGKVGGQGGKGRSASEGCGGQAGSGGGAESGEAMTLALFEGLGADHAASEG